MGKKAKKKIHKGSVQRPKKAPTNAVPKPEKIESNEAIGSDKACKHLDKGIDLEKLNIQLRKTSVLQCQGCLRAVGGKKEKKGKGKKGKGGSKDKKGIENPSGGIWVCLACGHVSCGGDEKGLSSSGHAWQHWLYAHHPYAVKCNDSDSDSLLCWCFLCKRSVQDNAIVEGEEGCLSLQLQALKLVEGTLINLSVNDNAIGVVGDEVNVREIENLELSLDGGGDVCCRGSKYIVRGLHNLGNTCFFNSVVQNLLALDPLRDYFMKSGEFLEGPITSALRRLFFETSSEGLGEGDGVGPKKGVKVNKTINPKTLFNAVCVDASQFRGFQQQDSHELWRYLLDSLHTEELSARKSRGKVLSALVNANNGEKKASKGNADENLNNGTHMSDLETVVDLLFGGQLCSTICCCKCGHSSVVYEPFYDLQLHIPTIKTPKEVSLSPYGDSSSSKANLKIDAKANKNGHVVGKRSSGIGDAQPQEGVDVLSRKISQPAAYDENPETEEKAENVPASGETTDRSRPRPKEETGWNGSFAPAEDNGWNESAPQEDTSWMDYLVSGTESDNILYQGRLDTSENVKQVENSLLNTISEGDFTLTDGSDTESSLPVLGDSEVLLLPYREVGPTAGQVLQAQECSVEMPQADAKDALGNNLGVDVSSIDPEPFDGFGQLFEEEETMPFQEKRGESESFLYDTNGYELLDTESSVLTSEMEQEMETTVIPMSLDGCLVDFTRLELLTGENAWKCEKCSSKVVETSDKLGKRSIKEDKSMGSESNLAVASMYCTLDTSSVCGTQVDMAEGEPNSLDKVIDTERQVLNISRTSGTSAMETDNSEVFSGRTECTGIGERIKCNKLNETELDHPRVLYSLNQPPSQEMHQMEMTFSHFITPINSSSEGASCSQAESCSNENLSRISGAELRTESDGIPPTERFSSTNLVQKGEGMTENLGEHDVYSPKHKSAGKGHILDKRKIKKTELNPNSERQEATKRFLISKAPPVLVIQLKRFTQDLRGRLSKLSGHVTFQERLDLRPFLDPRCPVKDNCIYRLTGVVEHLGTMRRGHYVAYVRCDQDENYQLVRGDDHPERSPWFCVNDPHVRRISFSEVLQSEAYLLFYEKCTSG